ncbi:hypothetical protein GQX73_g2771 [Xylaria multiplex]|uniref:BZIP domain-containing protein n=1 Tax=Xylaria multiplex TaxID=323545 RepID=A0A7C8IYD0_9PEZI|nr:hypothetical protein GQX73_g2771 [Xylaria multiplex]
MADASTQRSSLNEAAMKAADEELRRRRERGKLSQARFRKRQAQASQETRQENERMRTAIAAIVRATQCGSDRSSLLRAVRAAADVAGVDASGLDDGHRDEENTPEPGEREAVIRTSTEIEGGNDPSGASAPQTRREDSAYSVNQIRGHASRPFSANTASPPSGRLSPRLDYGIWVDARRAVAVSKPPTEIIPFLGAGQYTFSGRLYWACTDYLISLCRVVTAPHSPSPWFTCQSGGHPPSPGEAESRLWKLLQHSPPVPSVRMAQALAEAQQEYRDRGYIDGDSPACNPEIGTEIRQQIEATYRAHGRDLSVWMTLAELEMHVRRQLGVEAFARLESTITASCITPPPKAVDQDVRAIVRLLIKNLAESYTCFGDGPRWRVDSISALFSGMRM